MKTSGTKQILGDSRVFLGCIAGPQIPPSSHPIGAVAGCRPLQFPSICSFCQKTLSSGHSRLTEILKGCVILKSGPQMLNRNSSTKSLPALTSLSRFLLSLSVLFPPNFPHWQPESKSSPTICPPLTLTSTCILSFVICWKQTLFCYQEVAKPAGGHSSCGGLFKIEGNLFELFPSNLLHRECIYIQSIYVS